jgi:hypothetical protein
MFYPGQTWKQPLKNYKDGHLWKSRSPIVPFETMNPGLPVWQTSLNNNSTSLPNWFRAVKGFMTSPSIKPRFFQNIRPGGFLTTRKLSIISAV